MPLKCYEFALVDNCKGISNSMVNLAHYAGIKTLLDEVSGIAEELSSNERELFHTLAARYTEVTTGSFEDKTCLELMLRNIKVRRSYGLGRRPTEVAKDPG